MLRNERVIAWGRELQTVHQRLRDALQLAHESVENGAGAASLSADLQLFCQGFCVALTGHHTSEDTSLFPLALENCPELATVIATLKQDHSMLSHLIWELEQTLRSEPEKDALLRHLDGIEAVMTTHFRYEERRLVDVLNAIDDDGLDRALLLGPIAEVSPEL